MKENKRTIVMIVITIAVFLLVVVGATYAYFATERNVGSSINAGVATAKSSAFSSSTSGNIEFNVDFNEMSEASASNEYIKTDNATLSVDLSSEDERSTTICNYDIVWVWDSTDRYTQSDVPLTYTYDGIEYPYEFSVQVGTDVEKDLSSLYWDEEGTAIISSKTIEVAQKGSKHEDYDVVVRMYNIPVDQKKLFGKSFKAHIKVENLSCMSVRETKLAYYVIDEETETKIETVPKGDYKLNTDRTTCKRGGTVSEYNSITGELTTNIQMGDDCSIYFDKLEKLLASGADVTTNYDGTRKEIPITASDETGSEVTGYQVYYSLDKELDRENYSEGDTTPPEVKEIGKEKVYWCAVKDGYVPSCSSNDITIGEGIIEVNVSSYAGNYDDGFYTVDVYIARPTNATMYYSTTTPLTKDNYNIDGRTDKPIRSSSGTTNVYWCAVADKYTPQCGSSQIVVYEGKMKVSGTSYNGRPDGAAHSITVTVTKPTKWYYIYYSTTTELTKDNYTSGSRTNPTRSEIGTTKVYWCAVADSYTPVCSSNTITVDYPTLVDYLSEDVYNSDENQANIGAGKPGLYYHEYGLENSASDYSYRYAGRYNYPKAAEGYDTYDKIIIKNDYGYNSDYRLGYEETNTPYDTFDTEAKAVARAVSDGYLEEAVNNYVCFLGDNCSDVNNLYRIISSGVYLEKEDRYSSRQSTKVIKAISFNSDSWNNGTTYTPGPSDIGGFEDIDGAYSNIWAYNNYENEHITSSLYYTLNNYYLNDLGSEKSEKIDSGYWGNKGISKYQYTSINARDISSFERDYYGYGFPQVESKIGLIYVGEYMYATLPKYWLLNVYNETDPTQDCRAGYKDNWIRNIDTDQDWAATEGLWTLTPVNEYDVSHDQVCFINTSQTNTGSVELDSVYNSHSVRPTFHLKYDVKVTNYDSENVGSLTNPMIIK